MKNYVFFLMLLLVPHLMSAQEQKFLAEQFIQQGDTLNYRILYPEGYSDDKEYPLVLFLHGAGERGNDNKAQLTHGSGLFIENTEYPAIVLFPQCPKDDYWANIESTYSEDGKRNFHFKAAKEPTNALSLAMGLLDQMLGSGNVKKDQVYVGGLSMGGMGTFELLARRPNTFAAAIPICGGGDPDTADSYAGNTELWIFHGAKDDVVPSELSIEMANAINKAGGVASLTIYGNANHNSWDPTFAEPDLLNWLFSKRLELEIKNQRLPRYMNHSSHWLARVQILNIEW